MKRIAPLALVTALSGCAWFSSHKAAIEQVVADEVVCVAAALASGMSATDAALKCGVQEAGDIEKIILAQQKVEAMHLGAPKCAASASVKP